MSQLNPNLLHHLRLFEKPKRKALSLRYPILAKPAVFIRRRLRSLYNFWTIGWKLRKRPFMPFALARHSSLLLRKLGASDPQLQINKVQNLKMAIKKLDGLVIPPGGIFSLWHQLGMVNERNGYAEGMLLSNGEVSSGIGGGLCQLSNFLFWIFLHTDMAVLERWHHSVDVFPDSGRTLPFGSGATIFRNYVDLKFKNISAQPLQLKLWLTEACLKGQVLSDHPGDKKFHLEEKNHCFIKRNDDYFRFNEIFRTTLVKGEVTKQEKIVTNFAPVRYKITDDYLSSNHYKLIDLTGQ